MGFDLLPAAAHATVERRAANAQPAGTTIQIIAAVDRLDCRNLRHGTSGRTIRKQLCPRLIQMQPAPIEHARHGQLRSDVVADRNKQHHQLRLVPRDVASDLRRIFPGSDAGKSEVVDFDATIELLDLSQTIARHVARECHFIAQHRDAHRPGRTGGLKFFVPVTLGVDLSAADLATRR